MPGSIRVSVLKCVDLPAETTGGKYVSIKVGVGKREFQTKPSNVDGNKTTVWNSDFAFPVLNLRENIMVILLDSDGNAISQTEILTPVIVEKGSLEELFPLKGGGHVHLKLSFVLTLEERMRIEAIRDAAFEKKQRKTVNKNAIQIMKPVEENKISASDAAKGMSQTIPENANCEDDSQNEKNHTTPIVVARVSLSNEMQNEKKSIGEASPAPILPAIEYVNHQEAPSHQLKDISGPESEERGQNYLPQHDFKGELIQNKTESIDEGSLAPTCLPIEHDTHKEASSYDSKKISVCDLEEDRHQHLPPALEESGTTGSRKEFTVLEDTSSPFFIMSSSKARLEEAIELNPPFANEDLMPALLPNTKDTMKDHGETGNSDLHESIDRVSMIDPGQSELEKKDTTSISEDSEVISEVPSSQALFTRAEEIASSESCSLLESSDSKCYANSATLITGGDKTSDVPPEPIALVEVDGAANVLSVKASNEEGVANSQSSTDSSMPASDTGSGSIACGATEGPYERSSIHTVPSQSSSTAEGLTKSICSNIVNLIHSRVKPNTVVSTASSKPAASQAMKGSAVKAKIKAFESALLSQTMRGDGKRNGVKAKIKAFESNLTRDSDYHNVSPRKTNHKIEAERARQRLRAEAAAAEAAETKRRAEEEELKLKSITDTREKKSGMQHRSYESGVRTMVKLKRQYLERNEDEDNRKTKEDVKYITVAKEDRKINETYRDKEVRILKVHEKWPEIRERNIKQEDMTALRRPLKEPGENLLRATETKEKTAEENPRSIALNWERMRLAELQRNGNLQDETLQLDLSAKQKELVEEPTLSEMLASQSSNTSEQKLDVGVQAERSELYNNEPGESVTEARWIANEKAKQKHGSDHELILDQRVNSVTKRDSSEEEASLSEKKLEDLVNDSGAFGGFIKQAIGAAALLATGALFMWITGERMNRRARTIHPKYQPYFLPNDTVTSRIN